MKNRKLPEGWKVDRLKNYIREVSVRNKKLQIEKVLSVTNNKGFVESDEYFNKQVFSKNLANYKIVKKNQIAYNPSRINVGSIGVLNKFTEGIVSPLYVIFECNNYVYPKYLVRYLKSDIGKAFIKGNTNGSVRDTLKFSSLCNIRMPIPPLESQKKMIRILEKAEGALKKKREAIKLLDELVKSRFIEMFGDPIINSKGWEIKLLGEICEMKAGKNIKASHIYDKNSGNLYPCYGGNGLRGYVEQYSHEGNIPLIGRQGALCGNVKYAQGKFYATEHAVVTQPKVEMNSYWLYFLLTQLDLNRLSAGAAQPGLTVGKLNLVKMPIVPVTMQNQFADFVKQVDKLKFEMEKSLKKLEDNFNSLMQRAFNGELEFNSQFTMDNSQLKIGK